jgi:hypothetical protein
MSSWPAPPPPPRRQRKSALVGRLGRAKAELDLAQAKYDALVEQARTELGLGHHIAGNTEVLVTRNRQWDKAKAQEDFGNRICTPAVDMKLARFVLTGEQFESYYTEGTPRVIVKELESD